jgi:ABC-type molybdenum transport system ATPase subunit/photorepair protein PhrA
MRERALIHVAGPPGSGKTTFVEAILERRWRSGPRGAMRPGRCAPAGAGDSAQESSGAPAV